MASKQLQGFGKELGGMGAAGKVAAVGLAGVAAAGLGLVAGLGSAIGEAMDFESAMSAVAAVAGEGLPGDLERLSGLALELGQNQTLAGIGATDAARAMQVLAAAGLDIEDIMDGAALGALRLASAGGIDVARASEIAAMALANFGMEGKDTAKVADLFASAANSSAISVDDIAEALKYVGPIANSMGLSIEEVTATIAALGNQGIKASQAGTSLRSMLVNLAKPSKEANKIIKSLGLEFFDTNGKMKSLADVSEELKTGMADLTDQQRAAALSTLFGNEALTAATVLYGEGADGINKWLKEIEGGATAAEVGAKRNDNLKGSLEALKGAAETALIAFGMGLTPALKDLALGLAGGVSAAIPFLTMLGQGLGKALQAGATVIQRFGGYVAGVATAIIGAFQKLQAGEITLAQFIGGVKTLVTTVLGDIGTLLGRVADFLAPFLTKIGEGIVAALPVIGAELVKLGQAFGGWITGTAIPYMQANLPLWLGAISTWITGTALPAIATATSGLASALGGWLTTTAIPFLQTNLPAWGAALWDWITNTAVPTVVGRVVGLANALADWVTMQAVPLLNAKLPEWGNAISNYITATAVPTVRGQVIGLANALSDWIETQAVPRIQADMPALGAAIVAGILANQQAVNAPAEAWAREIGTKIGEGMIAGGGVAIAAAIENWKVVLLAGLLLMPVLGFKAGEAIGTAIGKGLEPGLKQGIVNILAFERDLLVALARIILPTTMVALNIGIAISQSLLNGIEQKSGEVWAWLQALPGRVQAAAGDMSNALYAAGVSIINGLLLGIQSQFGAVQALLGSLTNMLPNWKGPPATDAKILFESGQLVMQGLIDGIDDKTLDLQKKLADVTSGIAKAVIDMLGANRALAGLRPGEGPSGEQLGWFRHLTESLVATMQDAAKGFEEKGLKAATEFADAAGKVGSAVKNAVDGLLALGKADWATSSPTGSAMGWFTHLISSLVENFARAGAEFQGDALKVAGEFADAAGKVGGSVKNGVEGLKSLASADWAESSPSGSAMGWFTHLIASLTQNFATAAKDFDEGALGAASAFADSAGKVVATIGPAVQGFAAMATMAAPSEGAIDSLLAGVKRIVGRFAGMAKEMDAEGIKATGDFASAAGTALGAAKTGVELFAAMAGDKDKAGNHVPLMPPSAQAIDNLMAAIRYVIGKFREMAASMEQEGIAQMQTFATASGQVLGAAKAGTDLFKGMENLAVPAKESIDYLLGNIGYVISQTRAIATGIGTEGLKEAQSFATGSLTVITTIKNTLEMFKQIDAVKDIPAKILEDLHTALEGALDFAHKNFLRAEAIKTEAQAFLKSMQDAFHAFTQAQSLANGMGSMAITAPAGVGGGASGGGGGGGGGTVNNYTINTGDVYDGAKFEDRVVEAITTADRRGR